MSDSRINAAFVIASLVVAVLVGLVFAIPILWQSVYGGIFAGGLGMLILIGSVLTYFILRPAKLERYIALFYKLFRKINEEVDRAYVRKDIEATINSVGEEELGYPLSYGVSISWTQEHNRDSILADDEVILCLDGGDHQPKNIAKATLEYTNSAVVPTSRRHIKDHVCKGLDYSISENILQRTGNKNALKILYEDFIQPELESEEDEISENQIKQAYDRIEDTRRGGFLGPVLLAEYEKLTQYGIPDEEIREETEQFLEFLVDIVNREEDEEVDLQFTGDYIDVSIGLMSRSAHVDIQNYKKMAKINLRKSRTSYILAVGKNIDDAKVVFDETKDLPGVEEYESIEYELEEDSNFGEKPAFCARFEKKEGL